MLPRAPRHALCAAARSLTSNRRPRYAPGRPPALACGVSARARSSRREAAPPAPAQHHKPTFRVLLALRGCQRRPARPCARGRRASGALTRPRLRWLAALGRSCFARLPRLCDARCGSLARSCSAARRSNGCKLRPPVCSAPSLLPRVASRDTPTAFADDARAALAAPRPQLRASRARAPRGLRPHCASPLWPPLRRAENAAWTAAKGGVVGFALQRGCHRRHRRDGDGRRRRVLR